jgi:hypothetical protein
MQETRADAIEATRLFKAERVCKGGEEEYYY